MRELFGTDGIRGKAHQFPLDQATMFALGEVLAHRLRNSDRATPRLLLGMDTRESGPEIAAALAAGMASGGGEATFIGVVPTPAAAYLCRISDAAAAISISASHNPYADNGVKVFGHDGMKLPDAMELEIEQEMMAIRREGLTFVTETLSESPELIQKYEDFLVSSVGSNALRGSRIALDTGHGAAFRIGPQVFRRAGADVVVIHDQPNGMNINDASGALHPERLGQVVVAEGADLGVAFDGDADRAIFVDDRGNVRNGDEILYLWATRLAAKERLSANRVVATVMSNFGFERKLESEGIRLLRAAVGDKYVLEMMLENGAILGGEQSGHIIDLEVHTTGDGLHTALIMAELLANESEKFSEIPTFEPMPQILLNQKVRGKPPLETLPRYSKAMLDAENRIHGNGRILVRYSGTENLVRIMVEGQDAVMISTLAEELRDVLRQEIGEG